MNIPHLLHTTKRHKQETNILPHPAVFELPAKRWIFCEKGLITLRKRKENTHLVQFLSTGVQSQSGSKHKTKQRLNHTNMQQVLCIYQEVHYMNKRLQHILGYIWQSYQHTINNEKNQQKCCCSQEKRKDLDFWFMEVSQVKSHIEECSWLNKQQKSEQQSIKQQGLINIPAFTHKMVSSHIASSHPDDFLTLLKLPPRSIFSVDWSNNYIFFNIKHNDGTQISINQHMKKKIVSACQKIKQKIQSRMLSDVERLLLNSMQKGVSDDIRRQMMKKMEILSFKLWLYHNNQNNEAYCCLVSDIQLVGAPCKLYPEVNLHSAFQSTDQNHNTLNNGLCINIVQQQPQVQCQTCYSLITNQQTAYELTANHTNKIQYLRQVKMKKKIQSTNQYDFIKVCDKCYGIFKDYKHISKQSSKPKTIAKQKNSINQKSVISLHLYPKSLLPDKSSQQSQFIVNDLPNLHQNRKITQKSQRKIFSTSTNTLNTNKNQTNYHKNIITIDTGDNSLHNQLKQSLNINTIINQKRDNISTTRVSNNRSFKGKLSSKYILNATMQQLVQIQLPNNKQLMKKRGTEHASECSNQKSQNKIQQDQLWFNKVMYEYDTHSISQRRPHGGLKLIIKNHHSYIKRNKLTSLMEQPQQKSAKIQVKSFHKKQQ